MFPPRGLYPASNGSDCPTRKMCLCLVHLMGILYRRCKDQPLFSFCSITLAHGGAIESFAWDPVRSRLASVDNGEVKLWNISSEASMF